MFTKVRSSAALALVPEPQTPEDRLTVAQAEVRRLTERGPELRRLFKEALARGDGAAMVATAREYADVPYLLLGAQVRAADALITVLEPRVRQADEAYRVAEDHFKQLKRRLPLGRPTLDMPQSVLDEFNAAIYALDRAREAALAAPDQLHKAQAERTRLINSRTL